MILYCVFYTYMKTEVKYHNCSQNSAKTKRGANGKFLPKPLLFHLRLPNSKKISRVFCEILSPKNSFRKTESALVPPPARILGGQNTKEKCPFLFRRNWSRANPKSKELFSLVSAEALRGGGGTDSFVQFPLEKGSRKVYNYRTKMHKILVILGPTATGKSDLAVKLARRYNGEVISADSRKLYKGFDIGTGKIKKKEMQGVPPHMLDIVSPKKFFTVSEW